jgi:DNA repair protein RadC
VIVAHNHPSGDPSPSGEDLRISGELADAGRLLDIDLLDHLIIGRGRWTSLRALGALGQSAAAMR